MAEVVYDGGCGFCTVFKRWMERLDWLDRFDWVDLHDADYSQLPVAEEECVEAMQVVDHGTVYSGYDATRHILRSIPLLVPVAVVMHLPGVPFIGRRVYHWVATQRHCSV